MGLWSSTWSVATVTSVMLPRPPARPDAMVTARRSTLRRRSSQGVWSTSDTFISATATSSANSRCVARARRREARAASAAREEARTVTTRTGPSLRTVTAAMVPSGSANVVPARRSQGRVSGGAFVADASRRGDIRRDPRRRRRRERLSAGGQGFARRAGSPPRGCPRRARRGPSRACRPPRTPPRGAATAARWRR